MASFFSFLILSMFLIVKGQLSSPVPTNDGLYCLSCDDAVQPRHCSYVEQCDRGNGCFVEEYIAKNGESRFNMGCRQTEKCSNGNNMTLFQRTVDHEVSEFSCNKCCNTNLCNAHGCGEPGYPTQRGPVCFSCHQQLDPPICRKIAFCDTDEVCFLTRMVEFGDVLFSSGCVSDKLCSPSQPSPFIIGRRDAALPSKSSNPQHCCSRDICNVGLDGYTCLERMHWSKQPSITALASSTHPDCSVRNAVLDLTRDELNGQAAWAPAWCSSTPLHNNDYIQFDFGSRAELNGIITQGRNDTDQWVTRYKLKYSLNCHTWTTLDKEFVANMDNDTPKKNVFPNPVIAKCIQLYPTDWNYWPSLRIDFIGCLIQYNNAN